jgi:YfiH family protein
METDVSKFVFTDQTHTTNVRRVAAEDAGKGIVKERDYTDIDGLITNEPGLVLSTFYADCVPLYFVDPVHRAIGMSHSGWKGTVGKMGAATITAMKREFGTEAKDLVCAIGPSICQDCYEVSEDVADAFKEAFSGHADEILLDKKNGKYQLDLWRANEIVLTEAGVLKEKIAVTNICTCCNPDLLFSHRASHGKRGNLGAFIYLRNA